MNLGFLGAEIPYLLRPLVPLSIALERSEQAEHNNKIENL